MSDVTCSISKAIVLSIELAPPIAGGAVADGFRKRTYTIEEELLMLIDDKYYLKLSRQHMVTKRIMTMQVGDHTSVDHADVGIGRLHKCCDIPHQLAMLRDRAMKVAIVGEALVDKLPEKWCRIKDGKRWQAAYSNMPSVVEVMTPVIHDIPSIKMNIATSGSTSAGFRPVCMEITGATISWLSKAVAAQVASGEAHASHSTPVDDTEHAGAGSPLSPTSCWRQLMRVACAGDDIHSGHMGSPSQDYHCHSYRCDVCCVRRTASMGRKMASIPTTRMTSMPTLHMMLHMLIKLRATLHVFLCMMVNMRLNRSAPSRQQAMRLATSVIFLVPGRHPGWISVIVV